MIAPAVSLEEIQDQFVALLPELSGRLSNRFRYRRPEARAEAIAESIGQAWAMFLSARKKDKDITASNLAYYAGRSVETGRKLAGTANCDALSDTTVSRQRIGRHVSLEDIGENSTGFCRVFGDRRWKWPMSGRLATASSDPARVLRGGYRLSQDALLAPQVLPNDRLHAQAAMAVLKVR